MGDSLVVSMVLELTPGDGPSIRREVDRIIAERAEKQPLDFPSCGSTLRTHPKVCRPGGSLNALG